MDPRFLSEHDQRRAGWAELPAHHSRFTQSANLNDLPGQYGIQGIPQQKENGGLPAFGINGLATLGSNAFLPSDEVSSTIQVTDDFTKIYGKHTFKMGFEYQHVKFSTLQPPWSRGEFDFGSAYTDVPNVRNGNTGRAQFLLAPIPHTPDGWNDRLCWRSLDRSRQQQHLRLKYLAYR